MIRKIVHYDHPVLRKKAQPVKVFTAEIQALVDDLLESMRAVKGVGLAAPQIDVSLQLAVIDVTGIKERPSKMWIKDQPVDPTDYMPLILINPQLRLTKSKVIATEGCLSFPVLTLEIARAQRVTCITETPDGGKLEFEAAGLLGRAVQHETDHLHGKLFIDHISAEERREIKEDLELIKQGKPIPERD